MSRKIILFIIGILFTANFFVTAQKNLSIEDCVTGYASYLRPADLEKISWRPATCNFTYVEAEKLVQVPATGSKADQLTDLQKLNACLSERNMGPFSTFPDHHWINEHEILFNDNVLFIWYNIDEQKINKATRLADQAENIDFSPSCDHIAYTVENNLFVADPEGKIYSVSISRDRSIVSGQTVHRNEFGISKGTFWSPGGNVLAFYVKDETDVSDYPLVDVTESVAALQQIKYPMAGMQSEKVKVGIYHMESHTSVFLDTGDPDDHYLTNIAWSPDEKYIYLAELNRDQNHLRMNQYSAEDGSFVTTIFEEKDPMYVNPLHPIVFVPGKPDQFLWQSRKDGYNHLYLYHLNGTMLKQVTNGKWEVLTFYGFSQSGGEVFFIANKDGVLNEMLYRATLSGEDVHVVTPEPGVHEVMLNTTGDLIIDRFSSTTVPNTIQIRNGNGKLVNLVLKAGNPLKEYALATIEDGTIRAADDTTELHYRLFIPNQMVPGQKYPAVVYVYNGPLNQLIKNTWINRTELWLHYMANQGYAGFILDGRGSANRGRDFEQVIFRSLGTHEMKDQIKGVEFLRSLEFIDPGRIGVYGWSYGGFMTISLMTSYPEVFRTGVAGGPVTDWKYYEVMYGERYMDTPDTNPEGYAGTSVLNKVQNLKGNLLVIHGAMDPVVVWQHSLMLLRKCVEENVLVDYFVYPTHEHNVTGTDRVHLMRKVTDYFVKNL
ncbi:MAG: DPP IV N-terminal domain-containing protein [Bacteroidales bacterium]|nr:DPP IV N-terminal domain-containing protein [Bacteroidales bacterium]